MRDREEKGINRLIFGLLFLFILPVPMLFLAGWDGFDIMFVAPFHPILAAVLWMVAYLLVGVTIEAFQRKPLTRRQGDYLFLATGVISLVLLLLLWTSDENARSGPRSSIEFETQTKFASWLQGHRAAA
jgi:hypothetical protein